MNLFIRDVVTPLRGRNPILLAVPAETGTRTANARHEGHFTAFKRNSYGI